MSEAKETGVTSMSKEVKHKVTENEKVFEKLDQKEARSTKNKKTKNRRDRSRQTNAKEVNVTKTKKEAKTPFANTRRKITDFRRKMKKFWVMWAQFNGLKSSESTTKKKATTCGVPGFEEIACIEAEVPDLMMTDKDRVRTSCKECADNPPKFPTTQQIKSRLIAADKYYGVNKARKKYDKSDEKHNDRTSTVLDHEADYIDEDGSLVRPSWRFILERPLVEQYVLMTNYIRKISVLSDLKDEQKNVKFIEEDFEPDFEIDLAYEKFEKTHKVETQGLKDSITKSKIKEAAVQTSYSLEKVHLHASETSLYPNSDVSKESMGTKDISAATMLISRDYYISPIPSDSENKTPATSGNRTKETVKWWVSEYSPQLSESLPMSCDSEPKITSGSGSDGLSIPIHSARGVTSFKQTHAEVESEPGFRTITPQIKLTKIKDLQENDKNCINQKKVTFSPIVEYYQVPKTDPILPPPPQHHTVDSNVEKAEFNQITAKKGATPPVHLNTLHSVEYDENKNQPEISHEKQIYEPKMPSLTPISDSKTTENDRNTGVSNKVNKTSNRKFADLHKVDQPVLPTTEVHERKRKYHSTIETPLNQPVVHKNIVELIPDNVNHKVEPVVTVKCRNEETEGSSSTSNEQLRLKASPAVFFSPGTAYLNLRNIPTNEFYPEVPEYETNKKQKTEEAQKKSYSTDYTTKRNDVSSFFRDFNQDVNIINLTQKENLVKVNSIKAVKNNEDLVIDRNPREIEYSRKLTKNKLNMKNISSEFKGITSQSQTSKTFEEKNGQQPQQEIHSLKNKKVTANLLIDSNQCSVFESITSNISDLSNNAELFINKYKQSHGTFRENLPILAVTTEKKMPDTAVKKHDIEKDEVKSTNDSKETKEQEKQQSSSGWPQVDSVSKDQSDTNTKESTNQLTPQVSNKKVVQQLTPTSSQEPVNTPSVPHGKIVEMPEKSRSVEELKNIFERKYIVSEKKGIPPNSKEALALPRTFKSSETGQISKTSFIKLNLDEKVVTINLEDSSESKKKLSCDKVESEKTKLSIRCSDIKSNDVNKIKTDHQNAEIIEEKKCTQSGLYDGIMLAKTDGGSKIDILMKSQIKSSTSLFVPSEDLASARYPTSKRLHFKPIMVEDTCIIQASENKKASDTLGDSRQSEKEAQMEQEIVVVQQEEQNVITNCSTMKRFHMPTGHVTETVFSTPKHAVNVEQLDFEKAPKEVRHATSKSTPSSEEKSNKTQETHQTIFPFTNETESKSSSRIVHDILDELTDQSISFSKLKSGSKAAPKQWLLDVIPAIMKNSTAIHEQVNDSPTSSEMVKNGQETQPLTKDVKPVFKFLKKQRETEKNIK